MSVNAEAISKSMIFSEMSAIDIFNLVPANNVVNICA